MFTSQTIFFFQAEDGIRDGHVTGVQTCALPICRASSALRRPVVGAAAMIAGVRRMPDACRAELAPLPQRPEAEPRRSEERRVGKEGRARGRAGHEKG